ncbi:alanine--tRNA ligase [Candidatus Peregrinibacteria bacterium]|nr:alanine--tRNA ligase [Candidatus Peregrinibacteria bacterium]
MLAKDIRQKYLDFFVSKGHKVIPSAPLLPENDPTVLFTTAGMHPLVPYLLGEAHASGKRLANFQKCVRTGDIDEVGDDSHLTFFEMLGNWSLGDYFKQEAIAWSFEFLTSKQWLGIPINKLAVTCFGGDKDAPRDAESAAAWKKLGIPEERIGFLPKANNWWGPAGQTGPCGSDTEIFYWVGKNNLPPKGSNPANDEANWLEIWNDVFMEYNKTANGTFEPLKQKNVDTGMGLERVATVLQGKKSVYDTELFAPVLEKISTLAKVSYEENKASYRIIADHLRTATFMAADGVKPSNVDQGYVMRRLLRRAIRHGKKLGIDQDFTAIIAKKVIHLMSEIFHELNHEEEILKTIHDEEQKFRKTLTCGLREFEKVIEAMCEKTLSGQTAFHLYDTYGFPIEITQELSREKGLEVDVKGFETAFRKHQELSRAGAEQKFKGGLQDHSEISTKLHTATHLLQAALRKVLGDHVYQKGSNVTAERLRFDFSHPDKMTPEQLSATEKYVNDAIAANVEVLCETMTVDEAKKSGAIGLFDKKYGDQVKVYTISGWSKEICGGPHVKRTSELGHFKILKEEASSAGVRRIKAIVS